MRSSVAVAVLLTLSGCMSPYKAPVVVEVKNDHVFSGGFDPVWGATVEALTRDRSTIETSEKQSGLITATVSPVPIEFCNCPGGTMFIIGERRAKVNAYVKAVSESSTSVKVTGQYEGKNYSPGYEGQWIPCHSNGELERLLFARIDSALARNQ